MALKHKADSQQGTGKRSKTEETDAAGGASTVSSGTASSAAAEPPSVAANGATTPIPTDAGPNGATAPIPTDAEQPSVSGASVAVAASGASIAEQRALGIFSEEPPLPTWPTEDEVIGGSAPTVSDFMETMTKNVYWKLSVFLYNDDSIVMRKPLYTHRTPPFRTKRNSAPSTFKEPLNLDNCLTSLRCSGLYEGSITAWQFAACQTKWNGIDLGIDKISFKNIDACDGLWTKAALSASASNPDHERMIFPSFLPTAVDSTVLVAEMIKNKAFFMNLPACGGHAPLWSLIHALSDALQDPQNQRERILKLYEASVTITARFRLSPTALQMHLDRMGSADEIRMLDTAVNANSFFEFALEILGLPDITGKESGPELKTKLESFGVQYKGKKVERETVYSVLSLVGVADKGVALESVRFLERIAPGFFSDPTKVKRTFQTIKNTKVCGNDEWQDAASAVMEFIAIAILSGEKPAETWTGDFLVPKLKRQVGYVQTAVVKRKFQKWFMDDICTKAASGACASLTTAGVTLIRRKCLSAKNFWFEFKDPEADPVVGTNLYKRFDLRDNYITCMLGSLCILVRVSGRV